MPILRPYDPIGSTDDVRFETTKAVYETDRRATSTRGPQDSGWEAKLADVLERHARGRLPTSKNQGLNFKIPYTYEGGPANYVPDFIVRYDDGRARRPADPDPRGHRRGEEGEAAKVATAHDLWVPGRQQLGRPRPLGVPRGHRPVGRREPDPARRSSTACRQAGSVSMATKKIQATPSSDAGQGDRQHDGDTRVEHPDRRARVVRRRRGEEADDRALPPRPDPRPAARLEGQGRAGRPATSRCRPSRSTSRRRSTRSRSSRSCAPTSEGRRTEQQLGFFAPYTDLTFEEKVDFYRHAGKWTNRMILGDSLLVMTSLAEKEGLKGQVQTIYIDPPYGIKFGSNWQVSTRKRDVRDGKDDGRSRASPSRSGPIATRGSSGSTPTWRTCATGSWSRGNC